MDALKVGANYRQQSASTGPWPRHADGDAAILGIGFDQGAVALKVQNHPSTPAQLMFAQHVGSHNEAGQQPLGQDRVLVAKVEALGGVKLGSFVGLLLVEQVGDQVAVFVFFEPKAELKFAHQVEQKAVALGGVVLGIEGAAEAGGFEFAFAVGQLFRVEQGVNAAGDPAGVEHVGIAQAGVVFVVEGNAEAVEVDGEGVLRPVVG